MHCHDQTGRAEPALDGAPVEERTLHVGEPVDLSDLVALPQTPEVVQQATDRIMDALTALVAEIRGEEPPVERFDPRRAGVRLTGNPNKKPSKRERT